MDNITVNDFMETDLGPVSPDPRGPYDSTATYEHLSLVELGGGSYLCTIAPGEVITGIAPEPGKTTEYWQVLTTPGDLTPEYIAMHDRVQNDARQVAIDRAAVELSEQNISGMETNVEQMQADVQTNADQVARDKDSAAGYAQAAEVSRQAAGTSEQNVAALVNGFDSHVSQKTTDATGTIETARQQAVSVVQQQGAESAQGVIDDTEAYFEEKKTDALSEISDKTTEVVKSVTDEGTKQIGLVDAAGAAQVSAIEQEGTDQIANIQMEAESYIKREDANKLAFKGESEGRSHHVEDSADWGFLGMQGYGESTQVQTTGAQLFDASKIPSKTAGGATVTNNGDGSFTVSGSGAVTETFSNPAFYTREETLKILKPGTYNILQLGANPFFAISLVGTGLNKGANSQGTASFTVTQEDLDIPDAILTVNAYAVPGSAIVPGTYRPMFAKSDRALTESDWEPYTGGAPSPSTDYPQEIVSKCQARQLLNDDNFYDLMLADKTPVFNNPRILNATDKYGTIKTTIDTPGTYTLSCDSNYYFMANRQYLNGEPVISISRKLPYTFEVTTPGTIAISIERDKSATDTTDIPIGEGKIPSDFRFMINAGKEPGTWAPYGKYGLEYTVRTGQLVDYINSYDTEYNGIKMKIDRENGVVTFTGSNTAASAVIYHLELVRTVKAGETVYLDAGNNIANSNVSLRMYNKDTPVGVVTDLTAPNKKASYTVPADCNRITVRFAQGATANITLRPMLAVSDQDWQPCAAQTFRTTLDEPLRGIPVRSGGNITIDGQQYIADYIDWERGKRVQMVEEEIFDGSADEGWWLYAIPEINTNSFALGNPNYAKGTKVSLCNKYINEYGAWKIQNKYAIYSDHLYYNNKYFRPPSADITTVEQWRAWLAENPLTLVYALTEPIETDIPPEELLAYRRLHAYHGTTNIHNSDDVYTAVEYARDPDTYLNNKLAEISAAIIGG